MLPIQIQPVGQPHKSRYFIPFLYLLVTFTACYIFLLGVAHGNQSQIPTKFDPLTPPLIAPSIVTSSGRSMSKRRVPELDDLHFPWSSDPECSKYSIKFAKRGSFKPRALVSFPGSGNSWTRYLIEAAGGIFTGSIYKDVSLYRRGLLGEFRDPNDGSTVLQKTHHDSTGRASLRDQRAYRKLSELMFGYKGILLVRNPYESILSYWNWVHLKSHKERLTIDDPFAASPKYKFETFVKERIGKWTSLIKDWVENSDDLLIIFYDDLKNNTEYELGRILEYLDLTPDQGRLNCTLAHKTGPFLRDKPTSQVNPWANYPELTDLIWQNVQEVNKLFIKWEIPINLNYSAITN